MTLVSPPARQPTRARRLRRAFAIAAAAPWTAWAVVRVFGLDYAHPLVAAMAFTPYVAALSPVPVALAVLLRRWVVAAVAAVTAVSLALAVLPRGLDGPHDAAAAAGGTPLVVMSSNLNHGRADARALMGLVREHDVDVFAVQELTHDAVARLDSAGVAQLLPARVIEARPGASGSGLFTRGSLRAASQPERAGAAQPEGTVEVPGARPVRVKAVHPPPPISRSSQRDWRDELRSLPGPRAGATPQILAGDFNATLDHRELRRVLDLGFYDAADATGDGLRATWPVGRRRPGITIDHVLVPPPIRVRRVSVHEIAGTDHRALIAELVLP